ncbi:TlyA family RNA methyltransferase [Gulosibacter hominis]|uniref:TlyA family RNA methyltransferase n=1 Tax=Gulosibacter hominis TaxID=2770504 RepID=UPI001919D32C|nr:TlyA family RNA methyltransferase [Gulosibacter hominis]
MPERLDHALASRRLCRSRTAAARSIAAGQVHVNGRLATKASMSVSETDRIEVTAGPGYVSRAAQKLLAAADSFALDISGRAVLDLGASTGGFTQVLLERGAREVVALDVGHDQLDALLRTDTRVTVIEGENARYLTEQRLDSCIAAARVGRAPLAAKDITAVVGDLSFISLRHILPAVRAALPNLHWAVLLVKPQFEVGRRFVRGGIVTDAEVAADATVDVVRDACELGFRVRGFRQSPITGTHGNHEYLLWLQLPNDAHRAQNTASGDAASLDARQSHNEIDIAHIRETVVKGNS